MTYGNASYHRPLRFIDVDAAEIIHLADLKLIVPEDAVRGRDMKEKVRQQDL